MADPLARTLRRLLLPAVLLVLIHGAASAAEMVAELTINGLPPGVTAGDLAPTLAEKSGVACTKELEAADCTALVDALKDLGYREARVTAATAFVPGGVRLAFTVAPHSLVTVAVVQVPGLSKPEVQQLLDGLAITPQTPCTQEVCQRLTTAVAGRLGMNALFVVLDVRINASTHGAVLVFSG